MKTNIVREFFGLDPIETEVQEPDLDSLYRAEIQEVLMEMAAEHSDTKAYGEMVDHLDSLTSGYENFKKAEAEAMKADATIKNEQKMLLLNAANVGVKVLGIAGSIYLTKFFFGLEQGRPVPVRYVNKIQDFLTRTQL